MFYWLDIFGAVLGVVCTVLFVRLKISAWFLSFIGCLIGLYLYSVKGLYADVGLHLIYLLLTLYGFYQWRFGGKNNTERAISGFNIAQVMQLILISAISIAVLSYLLNTYTHSTIPLWDASTTVLSLVAQWLLCRKNIATWLFWFVADALFAGLYFYKGIPAHGIVYVFYTLLAISGYWQWKRILYSACTNSPYKQTNATF